MNRLNLQQLVIIKYPDPRLRKVCAPITEFGPELEALARRMLELMKMHNGIGLAGPQVGILKRVFVCNHTGEPQDDMVVVNPQLEDLVGAVRDNEGCLSIPEVNVEVQRAQRCLLKAQDAAGNPLEQHGVDLQARVWQHENDHLNGKLILDYMDDTSRLANRRAIRYLETSFSA